MLSRGFKATQSAVEKNTSKVGSWTVTALSIVTAVIQYLAQRDSDQALQNERAEYRKEIEQKNTQLIVVTGERDECLGEMKVLHPKVNGGKTGH